MPGPYGNLTFIKHYNIADRLGLVRQQYFKFAIGFTLFAGQMENGEYWFMRSKFD